MPQDIAADLVNALYRGTDVPSGCRVNHARGYLVEGVFRPGDEAAASFAAPVFAAGEQPLLARFSTSGGNGAIREDDPEAEPRGLALTIGAASEFTLIGHSIEGFPARDPAAFLDFLQALAEVQNAPEKLAAFLEAHPSAQRFVDARHESPAKSFTSLDYHMLHPFRLRRKDGSFALGRLGVSDPETDRATAPERGPDFLDEGLRAQMAKGTAKAALVFAPMGKGDAADDISAAWGTPREVIPLGTLLFRREAPDQDIQRKLVFDPSNLPDGIAFAGDPMIEARIRAYKLAAARRLSGL